MADAMEGRGGAPRRVKLAPSLLAADFGCLREAADLVAGAGADLLHLDVMDGRFVPNLSMGPQVVEALRPHTDLPLDVHLMVEEPGRFVPDFARAGADLITVHAEACRHLHRVVQQIRALGVRPGVALNPATPVEALRWVVADIDLVLIMTVNPGFSGQKFIAPVIDKVAEVERWRGVSARADLEISVDGGIDVDTAPPAVARGASIVVAGWAVFGSEDIAGAVGRLRRACAAAAAGSRL